MASPSASSSPGAVPPVSTRDLSQMPHALAWAHEVLNGSTTHPVLAVRRESPMASLAEAHRRSVATLLLLQAGQLQGQVPINELKNRVHLVAVVGAPTIRLAAARLEVAPTALTAAWSRHLTALGLPPQEHSGTERLMAVHPDVRAVSEHIHHRAMYLWDNLVYVHNRRVPTPSETSPELATARLERPPRPLAVPATPAQLDTYRGWYNASPLSSIAGADIQERVVAALRLSVATLHLLEAKDPSVQISPRELTRRVVLATAMKTGNLEECARVLGYSSAIVVSTALKNLRRDCRIEGGFRDLMQVRLPEGFNSDLDNLPEHTRAEWQDLLTQVRQVSPVTSAKERLPQPRPSPKRERTLPRVLPRDRRSATEAELELYQQWYSDTPCCQVVGTDASERLVNALKVAVATLHLLEAKKIHPEINRFELADRAALATCFGFDELSSPAKALGYSSATTFSMALAKLKTRMGLAGNIRELRESVLPEELRTALSILPLHTQKEWCEILRAAFVPKARPVEIPPEVDLTGAELPVRRRGSWQVRASDPQHEAQRGIFEDAVSAAYKRLVDLHERRRSPAEYPSEQMEADIILCALARAAHECVYEHLDGADRSTGQPSAWREAHYVRGVFAEQPLLAAIAAEYIDYGSKRTWDFDRLPSLNLGWWQGRVRELCGQGTRYLAGIPLAAGA